MSFGMLALILDGRTAIDGARQGIELCLRTVIPSLFPFFVLSILLTSSLLGSSLAVLRPLGRLFGMPDGAESLLIPAFLGGYPVGAQNCRRRIPQRAADKTGGGTALSFCSNAGPAFLFGMAAAMFPRRWMAWALWGIHIVGALFAALLIPGKPAAPVRLTKTSPHSSVSALNTAITVMATVCGWVVLFRVLLAFLKRWIFWILPAAVQVAVTGILELSNGCCELLGRHGRFRPVLHLFGDTGLRRPVRHHADRVRHGGTFIKTVLLGEAAANAFFSRPCRADSIRHLASLRGAVRRGAGDKASKKG